MKYIYIANDLFIVIKQLKDGEDIDKIKTYYRQETYVVSNGKNSFLCFKIPDAEYEDILDEDKKLIETQNIEGSVNEVI